MTRISAIALSLLLMIGLTAEAQAVTSGAVKCVALQGPSGADLVASTVTLYNPNGTGNQNITRLRIYDSTGATIVDLSFAPPLRCPDVDHFPSP